jgi:hypothetical protein
MLVESAGRRDSASLTPLLEADMSCVGILRLTIEEPFDLESAVWTSIASIVAPPSVTATHSGDPKDPGVASRTLNRAAPRRVCPRGASACSISRPE